MGKFDNFSTKKMLEFTALITKVCSGYSLEQQRREVSEFYDIMKNTSNRSLLFYQRLNRFFTDLYAVAAVLYGRDQITEEDLFWLDDFRCYIKSKEEEMKRKIFSRTKLK